MVKSFVDIKAMIDVVSQAMQKIGQAVQFVKDGAHLEQVRVAFDNMAKAVGQDSDELLSRLRAASRGTLAEVELVAAASKAALFKLPLDQLDKLMEIARASAIATGQSVQFMFDSIVTGIARGSPMILDNLGITIKIEEATKKYAESIGKAADELTAAERSTAIYYATVEAGEDVLNRVGAANEKLSDAERIAQAEAAWKNLTTELKTGLVPILVAAAEAIKPLLDWINEQLGTVNLKQKIAGMSEGFARTTLEIQLLGQELSKLEAQYVRQKEAFPNLLPGRALREARAEMETLVHLQHQQALALNQGVPPAQALAQAAKDQAKAVAEIASAMGAPSVSGAAGTSPTASASVSMSLFNMELKDGTTIVRNYNIELEKTRKITGELKADLIEMTSGGGIEAPPALAAIFGADMDLMGGNVFDTTAEGWDMIAESVKRLNEEARVTADAMKSLEQSIRALLASSIVDGFAAIGAALYDSASGTNSFSDALGDIVAKLLAQLPLLLVTAGLQILIGSMGLNPLGYVLLALGGGTAMISGFLSAARGGGGGSTAPTGGNTGGGMTINNYGTVIEDRAFDSRAYGAVTRKTRGY